MFLRRRYQSLLHFSSLLLLAVTVLCNIDSKSYLVLYNASDLVTFSSSVYSGTSYKGTTVYLGADVEFDDNISAKYLPPGEYFHGKFIGTFDGQGYTLSGLKMKTDFGFVGLIGYSHGASVRNVVIDSSCIITSDCPTDDQGLFIGSVLGGCDSYDDPCFVENSVNMATVAFVGNVTILGGTGLTYIGGIVGQMYIQEYDVVVRNCVNYGTLERSGDYRVDTYFGGIVGDSNGALIQNCLNFGPVFHNETTGQFYIGGIVGKSSGIAGTTIENCVSAGKIIFASTNGFTGNINGLSNSHTNVTHCFWTNDMGCGDAAGSGAPTVTNSSLVTLNSAVVGELNEYAAQNNMSGWLLNTNNASVSFEVNNRKSNVTFTSQLILFPDLAENDNGENRFSGWYNDAELTESFAVSEVAEDTKFYGSYGVICIVTFNPNGGNISSARATKVVKTNEEYGALPEAEWFEHTFPGWFTGEVGGDRVGPDTIVALAGDHVLHARWVVNSYTVTFDFDNGTTLNETFQYNTEITYPDSNSIVMEGHTFNGWDTDITTMPSHNLTIKALWKAINYTVTFDFDNGTAPLVIEVEYGAPIPFPPEPTKEGYSFTGWANHTEAMPNYNLTMTAQWVNASQYVQITFAAGDLTEEEVREIIAKYTSDDNFAIQQFGASGGNIVVIVKFSDTTNAMNFVENIKESSDTKIVNASYYVDVQSVAPKLTIFLFITVLIA